MLFKYSGNKWKVLDRLALKLPPHKRLAELYLGSGAFLLSNKGPSIGIDVNKNIIDLWNWLKTVTPEYLRELEVLRQKHVNATPNGKPDVREMGLEPGAELYMRVNVTGVYVGQLSSWKVYPKWKLPVEKTIQDLDRVKEIEIVHGKAHVDYKEQDGDIVFLDPPYAGTKANYKQDAKVGIEESYKPQDTVDLISRLSCPVILTYGTDAKTVFPQYEWKEVLRKKVPLIRKGGTIERIEHVAYINWETQ
jgi:site-specific DNA-adenine methylase